MVHVHSWWRLINEGCQTMDLWLTWFALYIYHLVSDSSIYIKLRCFPFITFLASFISSELFITDLRYLLFSSGIRFGALKELFIPHTFIRLSSYLL
ncbi:hypothetical protein V8C34DRAFT_297874 [Trichoderma compactum]